MILVHYHVTPYMSTYLNVDYVLSKGYYVNCYLTTSSKGASDETILLAWLEKGIDGYIVD